MSMTNSTWLVQNAIWTILEAESDFTDAVPSGNRIKYTDTTDPHPDKMSASTADFPLVRVSYRGLRPQPHHTSNSSVKGMRWSIDVFSGDQRLADFTANKIADIDDAIFKAMVNWKTTMSTFTFASHGFIVPWCGTLDANSELTSNELHRSQRGWQTVWTGETDVWFTTTDLT